MLMALECRHTVPSGSFLTKPVTPTPLALSIVQALQPVSLTIDMSKTISKSIPEVDALHNALDLE